MIFPKNEEIYYKSLPDCNALNFHTISTPSGGYVVSIFSQNGELYEFHFEKNSSEPKLCAMDLKSELLSNDVIILCSETLPGTPKSLIAVTIDNELKFVLFDSCSKRVTIYDDFQCDYVPCLIKSLPESLASDENFPILISGHNKTLNFYQLIQNCQVIRSDDDLSQLFDEVILNGVVICINYIHDDDTHFRFLLGLDTGDVSILNMSRQNGTNWILGTHQCFKFDTPVSSIQFLPLKNSRDDAQAPSFVFLSQALGPAIIGRLNDGDDKKLNEYLALLFSDRYDVVVCCAVVAVNENFYVFVGTFSCKLLFYKILVSPKKNAELLAVKEFLSPIVGLACVDDRLLNVLTYDGFFVFDINFTNY